MSVKDLKVTKSELKPMVPAFEEALEQLQQVLQVRYMIRYTAKCATHDNHMICNICLSYASSVV